MSSSGLVSLMSLKRANEQPWARVSDPVVVGKDILELLSTSMYVDPMTIYREYVQNAADSIDEARVAGVLPESHPGSVEITIEPLSRTVRIRDNGMGLTVREFAPRLTAFGASAKRGSGSRGFRGVGRLAGIGYCQSLIFRSRAQGENEVSELRWDCKKLKDVLRDGNLTGDLGDIVRETASCRRIAPSGYPDRFFEVELQGIVRHRDERLLDSTAIESYLSQIAPVPFSPDFKHAREIADTLRPKVSLGEIELRLLPSNTQVYRPHRNELSLGPGKVLAFDGLEWFTIPAADGRVAAVGWILNHSYGGALPPRTLMKGLRLRVGNIQVGDDRLLEEQFLEPRFNSWSVGEIHVIDPRIVPNGRRDHFEQTIHYHDLVMHVLPKARELSQRCRTSSIKRNTERQLSRSLDAAKENLALVKQGVIAKTEQQRLLRNVGATLAAAEKMLSGDLFASQDNSAVLGEIQAIKRKLVKLGTGGRAASPLAHLPKLRRQAYETVFSLIYKCAPSKPVAKAIVDRVLARLN
jgi:hypothetical protein